MASTWWALDAASPLHLSYNDMNSYNDNYDSYYNNCHNYI